MPAPDIAHGGMTRVLRTSLTVMALCVAAFVGCFAIGRTERPKVSTGEGLSSSQPTASTGASIPLALAGAPSIDMRDVGVSNGSAAGRRGGAAKKSRFAHAAATARSSGTSGARTDTQSANAPEVTTPISSSEHLGTTTYAPDAGAVPTRHAPAAKTESNASHSFDSSD